MKKIILTALIAVIVLSVCAGGTIAYFTASEIATNVITAGNLKIELVENMISKETGELVVFEDRTGVSPGEEVSKIVQVKNTGDNEAFVRIAVKCAIELAAPDGNGSTSGDTSVISFDFNTEKWTEKDGVYYYNQPLPAGETTEPLFTKVVFSGDMKNDYMESKTTVVVCAQAVQTANNGESATDAAGWPDLE